MQTRSLTWQTKFSLLFCMRSLVRFDQMFSAFSGNSQPGMLCKIKFTYIPSAQRDERRFIKDLPFFGYQEKFDSAVPNTGNFYKSTVLKDAVLSHMLIVQMMGMAKNRFYLENEKRPLFPNFITAYPKK